MHNPILQKAIDSIETFRSTDNGWKEDVSIDNLENFTKEYALLYEVFQEVIEYIDEGSPEFIDTQDWIDTSERIDRVLFGDQEQ